MTGRYDTAVSICRKLLSLPAAVESEAADAPSLAALREAEVSARLAEIDTRNARFFDEEVLKLDRWSEDLKLSLEHEIKELDKQIRELRRTAALAQSLQDKLTHQKQLRDLERRRNAKRRELFDAQDAIDGLHSKNAFGRRLFVEFARMSPELRALLLSLDTRLKQATDKAVDIYLGRNATPESETGKSLLIKQGSVEKRLFKISQGKAFVVKKTDAGEILVGNLGKGDFTGSIPFVDIGMEPDSASVYTSDDIELSPVEHKRLQREYENLSATFRNIVENLSTSISVTAMVAADYFKEKMK